MRTDVMGRVVVVLSVLTTLCGVPAPAQVAASPVAISALTTGYTITPIEVGSGFGGTGEPSINNAGQVAGWGRGTTTACTDCYRAFLWTPDIPNGTTGKATLLDPLPSDKHSDAVGNSAINDLGQVVGRSFADGPDPTDPNAPYIHAVRWQDGTPTKISELQSYAYGINHAGQVVGFAYSSGNGSEHAFLWQNGDEIPLFQVSDPNMSQANDINNSGQVVGYYTTSTTNEAFLWTPSTPNGTSGTMTRLVPFSGSPGNEARGINDAGQVVGSSWINGISHAAIWQKGADGQMQPAEDLGVLPGTTSSVGYAINAAGQVVGVAGGDAGVTMPFLWQNGAMIDLNSLLPSNSGWVLKWATGINDAGQIVGIGALNGQSAFFLLTPATSDPPPAVVILVMGVNSCLVSDISKALLGECPPINTVSSSVGHTFNPLKQKYTGLKSCTDCDAYLMEIGNYFNPKGAEQPDLTDTLAAKGAVLLPFSYSEATLARDATGQPEFTASDYDQVKPNSMKPEVAAIALDNEVQSIHQVWPTTPIAIVGHSEGGAVAEAYFMQSRSLPPDKQARVVFSIDSPINGVGYPAVLCGYITSLCTRFGLAPPLAQDYYDRWIHWKNYDGDILTADPGGQYTAIGTPGDGLFRIGNLPLQGINSQLVYKDDGTTNPNVDCTVTGSPPWNSSVISSHGWALGQREVIDNIAGRLSAVTAGPTPGSSPKAGANTTAAALATGQLATTILSVGQATSISGTGLGTTAGQVWFTGANDQWVAGAVTSWTDTAIALTVPVGATTGPVYAVTAAGESVLTGLVTILGSDTGVAALQVQVPAVSPYNGQPASVAVTALDAAQQPLANVPVSLSDGVTVLTATTNAAGLASFTVTGFGSENVVAFSGTAATPVTLMWQEPPPAVLALVPSVTTAVPGQTVTLTATLTTPDGQPLANQPVVFTANGRETAVLGTPQATTNAAGVATTTLTDTTAGFAVISAWANYGAVDQSIAVTWALPTLTITPPVGGAVTANPTPGPYPVGSTVTLTATPTSGYTFSGWTVDGTSAGSTNPLTLTMNADHTVAATFTLLHPVTYALTVTTSGSGTVSASPSSGPYPAGTVVTLAATPAPGYTFSGWTMDDQPAGRSNPLQITMVANHAVQATFAPASPPPPGQTYTLSVTTSGNGTVTTTPPGGLFSGGTDVALTATPAGGALFTGWVVDSHFAGWANPLTLTINADHTIQATFATPAAFSDLGGDPYASAIQQLTARQIIHGYGTYGCQADHVSYPCFGPHDPIKRAEMAAMIVRTMTFVQAHGWPGPASGAFPDQCNPPGPYDPHKQCIDPELWSDVLVLNAHQVARGYNSPAACDPVHATAPCYQPFGQVLYVQAVSFVSRAMVNAGYWQQKTGGASLFGGAIAGTGNEDDVATYLHYVGSLPTPTAAGVTLGNQRAGWVQPATRDWFSALLWAALNSQFGH